MQIASVGAPLLSGMAIGFSIKDDILGWYKTLRKPSWNPPNWLFGPVRMPPRAVAGVVLRRSAARQTCSCAEGGTSPSEAVRLSVLQMWSILYCAMGVAAHRVWKAGGGPVPLTLYAVQLALNLAWRWASHGA